MGSVTQNKRRKRETKTCEIKWDHEIEESKISVLMKHSQSICAAFKEKTLFWFRTFIFDFLFSHILKHAFFLCTAITWLVIFFLSFHRFDIVCVMRWSFICSANRTIGLSHGLTKHFFSLSLSLFCTGLASYMVRRVTDIQMIFIKKSSIKSIFDIRLNLKVSICLLAIHLDAILPFSQMYGNPY